MGYRRRLIRTTLVFLKIFLNFRKELALSRRLGYRTTQERMAAAHSKRAKELYDIAVESGGVFIKLCQFFSSRRDIFPEPYIKILSPLQDQVPPVAFEVLEPVLEKAFGDYQTVFRSVDSTPLASASLGQTHRAELPDGTQVVIKILKPDVKKTIDIDFAILFHVFSLLSHFKAVREIVNLLELLDEFVRVTGDELNFLREIHVLKQLKKGLGKFDFLYIPEVHEELCSQDVIVMEYCRGDKISDIAKWQERNNDPVILAQRLVDIYMAQFLELDWIHFDPHPGNILVTSNNSFVLLDFGMSGQISEKTSKGIRRGLRAIVRKDFMDLIDTFDELGFVRKNYNRYKLLPVLEYFFNEVFTTLKLEREALQSVDLSPVVEEMVELLYRQPVVLPSEWAFIGRAVGTLSGIVSTLNPNFRVANAFEPYLKQIVSSSTAEIIEETTSYAKNYGMRLVNLPLRLSNVVEKVERGDLRFKIELDEVDDRIAELKSLFLTTSCTLCSILCFGTGYTLYSVGLFNPAYLFASIGTVSLLLGVVMRKKRQKQYIRTQLLGIPEE